MYLVTYSFVGTEIRSMSCGAEIMDDVSLSLFLSFVPEDFIIHLFSFAFALILHCRQLLWLCADQPTRNGVYLLSNNSLFHSSFITENSDEKKRKKEKNVRNNNKCRKFFIQAHHIIIILSLSFFFIHHDFVLLLF